MYFISGLTTLMRNGDTKTVIKSIVFAVLYVLFSILVSKIILRKTPKYEKGAKQNKTLLIISAVLNITFVLLFGFHNLALIKASAFMMLLLYATASDIQDRSVHDCISLMILLLGFIYVNRRMLIENILVGVGFFIFFLVVAMIADGKFGGADMKIASASAFVLGLKSALAGTIIGLALSVIITLILRKKSKSEDKTLPLVPYLSCGFLLSYIIQTIFNL